MNVDDVCKVSFPLHGYIVSQNTIESKFSGENKSLKPNTC